MNTALTNRFAPALLAARPDSQKARFRQQFQRSLQSCVRRGFSVEESFGMIWVETWEDIPLTDREQAELYDQLLEWAKTFKV